MNGNLTPPQPDRIAEPARWWEMVLAALSLTACTGALVLIVLHAGRGQGIW